MENSSLSQWVLIVNIIVAVATFGLVIATVMMTYATKRAAEATEKIVEAQYKPWVVMYIKPNWQGCYVDIYVKNVGHGPAYDISFGLPDYFPNPMASLQVKPDEMPENLDGTPLRNGMSFLAAGEYWKTMWGDYADLLKGLDGKPLEINIRFKTAKGIFENSRCVLDIRDFAFFGTDNFEGETVSLLRKQADSLAKLATSFASIANKIQ